MARRTSFFDSNDSPHGLAKRIMLFRFLQSEFARGFRTQWKVENQIECNEHEYDMTYFDAFAGTGLYQNSGNAEDIQYVQDGICTCPFEDEKYGSPLVALYALYQHLTQQKLNSSKKVLVVFIEKNKTFFLNLKNNVTKFISSKSKTWKLDGNRNMTWDIPSGIYNNMIFIQFYNCSFKDFDDNVLNTNQPMVSFFDPFGFSHTPMDKVRKYVGIRRSLILNFMVSSINRFLNTEKNQDNFEDLFGRSQWQEHLPSDFYAMPVPKKMKTLACLYQKYFKETYQEERGSSLPINFLEFSMRKGSELGTQRGIIYYLLFAAIELRTLANMKYDCHVIAQNFKLPSKCETSSGELFFCDYYFDANTFWRPHADKEDEAMFIYNRFKGTTQKFGKIKEWIILESPYLIKSSSFKYLLDNGYLEVVSFNYDRNEGVEEYKPRRGAFPRHVGVKHDDPDWDKRLKNTIRYCNGWELKFHDIKQEMKPRKRRKLATDTPSKNLYNAAGRNVTETVTKKLNFEK